MRPALVSLLLALLLASRWLVADLQQPWRASAWTALAALGAVWLLSTRSRFLARAKIGNARAALYGSLALALLALLSSLWSLEPSRSLVRASALIAVSLFFVALAQHPVASRLSIAWSIAVGGALASAMALHQVLVGFPALRTLVKEGALQLDSQTFNTVMAGRAFGSFYAPDMLGAALAIALLVSLGLFLELRGYARLIAALLGLTQLAGLASTRSVGATAALGLGLLWIFAASLRRLSRSRQLTLGLSVALILGLALVAVSPRLHNAQRRFGLRLNNQYTALRSWQHAPILGHGVDSFGLRQPIDRAAGESLTLYAHGLIGQNLSDLGMGGVIITGLWIFLLGALVWRSRRASYLQLGAAAAVLAGLAHALADYDLLFGENLAPLLAVVALSDERFFSDLSQPEINTKAPSTCSRLNQSLRWLLIALALGVAIFSAWKAIAQWRLEQAFNQLDCVQRGQDLLATQRWSPVDPALNRRIAEQLRHCPATQHSQANQALALLNQALKHSPHDALLRGRYALVLAQVGQRAEALAQIDQAIRIWPSVGRLWNYRAQIAFVFGDADNVERFLQRAQDLDPHDPSLQQTRDRLRAAKLGRPDPGLRPPAKPSLQRPNPALNPSEGSSDFSGN